MLINNTLFLREYFPGVREYFRDNERNLELHKVSVLDSKVGVKTIKFQTKDNEQFMVHSNYNPKREAERIINSHSKSIDNNTHVFFYGIGMGYHIEKFVELFPDNSFSAYEPVPEIFFTLSSLMNLNGFLTNKMRRLYIDTHISESNEYIEEFNHSNSNIHIIILPSYENIIKDKVSQFHSKVKETVQNRRTALHTNNNFQKLWVKNSVLNFNTVLNTPNILKDIDRSNFEGKPALVISAGPSLSEDIEYIRYIKENNLANIFSVGSAINSLIEYNIMPDAVCTYDPGELNYKVFDKMIAQNIDNIPMVFGSSVGYKTLAKYNGPKVHFITTQDRTTPYFLEDQINFEEDLIVDSPSIAVMTFQILNKLKADPIIFSGQNLGYLYNRLYSKGIDYEHINSEVNKEKLDTAPTTNDVYGNEIKTSIGFNKMRESIEQVATQYPNTTFINTTKGGATIEGVPFQTIENVIKDQLATRIEKNTWWLNGNRYELENIKIKVSTLKTSRKNLLKTFSEFESLISKLVSKVEIKKDKEIQNLLVNFDSLYNKLNKNDYYRQYLSFFIRVEVQFMANEIRRLNYIHDMHKKGKEIIPILEKFIRESKKADKELEELIKNLN